MSFGVKTVATSAFVVTWAGCKAVEHFFSKGIDSKTKIEFAAKLTGDMAINIAGCNMLLSLISCGTLRVLGGDYKLLAATILGAVVGGYYMYSKTYDKLMRDEKKPRALEDDELFSIVNNIISGMVAGGALLSLPLTL